jgi:histone deacetylase complex subunit SAP18
MAASVDRSVVTPFLLRVFISHHFSANDFDDPSSFPNSELHLYTWRDATLQELVELVRGVDKAAQERDQDLFFSLVVSFQF